MSDLLKSHVVSFSKVSSIRSSLNALPDYGASVLLLDNAIEKSKTLKQLVDFSESLGKIKRLRNFVSISAKQATVDLEDAEKNVSELLKMVDMCPFCQRPIDKCTDSNVPVRRARRSV